jgi:hypothetical protein
MSECERYEEALIDHALGAPADPALEGHLPACAACRARLDQERRLASTVDGILKSTLDVAPALGFDLAVRRRVAGTRPSWRGRPLVWIAGGIAAAAALLLILRQSPEPSQFPAVAGGPPPAAAATSVPAPMHVVPGGPAAPGRVEARQTASPRRNAHGAPAEVVTLVPADTAEALKRYMAQLHADGAPAPTILLEPPLPVAPVALEVGTLAELPRLSTADVRRIEPPTPLDRLASGGDI